MDSRLDSRSYDWFAVTTRPQREIVAATILEKQGFAVFVPTETRWRWVTHKNRIRKRKFEVEYPLIPRYVFIGMNAGTPGFEGLFCFMQQLDDHSPMTSPHMLDKPRGLQHRLITGIIGHQGVPVQIPHDGPQGLRNLMWLHSGGKFRAPSYHRYMETHREYQVGDRVEVDGGIFEGKVTEVTSEGAKVLVEFFGSQRLVSVGLEKIAPAA